jgi:hypothetical protein
LCDREKAEPGLSSTSCRQAELTRCWEALFWPKSMSAMSSSVRLSLRLRLTNASMSSAIVVGASLHDRWEGGEPWSEASPLPQLRQLGDVGGDAPRFVAGQQVCHRPAAGSSAACSSTLLVRAAVY